MALSDQGYRKAKVSRSGGGGRLGRTLSTYVSKARKNEVADMMLRTRKEGILTLLGIAPTSDMAAKIREGLEQESRADSMTKAEMEASIQSDRDGMQAFDSGKRDNDLREGAETLIAALQSATKGRELDNLDEGDWIDDLPTLMIDGASWGEEVTGATQYKKHVNICIDNSGSTHMASTGYCSQALLGCADAMLMVLYGAGFEFPGITWDKYTFNRIATQHTGEPGVRHRQELVHQALRAYPVRDPLDENAKETNLAPLMQKMYENEVASDLLGTPRLDIILTDGEWETQQDADDAGQWQRMRGNNVTTYVLNICPETIGDIALPANFRVVPVECITRTRYGQRIVDKDVLRQTLMSIVVQESQNL